MAVSVDDFRTRGLPGLPCGVATALASLDPKVRAVFVEAMALPTSEVQHSAVARQFVRHGLRVSGDKIGRHRRGDCRCG